MLSIACAFAHISIDNEFRILFTKCRFPRNERCKRKHTQKKVPNLEHEIKAVTRRRMESYSYRARTEADVEYAIHESRVNRGFS